jgi:alpha-ribazole phosphatase
MIFLRHPVPEVRPGICYGRLDLDIAAEGHAQIARALEETPTIARVIASPALRCRELALALANRDRIEPVFDARLWEMHMGDWEGMAWAEIPREHSGPWAKDPFNLPTPGGESFRQLQQRVLEAIAAADKETAVVCHAGPIRAVQMAWHGLSFHEAFSTSPRYCDPIELHPPADFTTPAAPAGQAPTAQDNSG